MGNSTKPPRNPARASRLHTISPPLLVPPSDFPFRPIVAREILADLQERLSKQNALPSQSSPNSNPTGVPTMPVAAASESTGIASQESPTLKVSITSPTIPTSGNSGLRKSATHSTASFSIPVDALETAFAAVPATASKLALSFTNVLLGDHITLALLDTLREPHLGDLITSLALRKCCLSASRAPELTMALKHCPNLTRLDLSHNPFSKAAPKLIRDLSSHRTLSTLALSNIQAEAETIPAIHDLIAGLSSMCSIDLSNNKFGQKVSEELLSILDEFPRITCLRIHECSFQNKDSVAIAKKEERNKFISEVMNALVCATPYYALVMSRKSRRSLSGESQLRLTPRAVKHWSLSVELLSVEEYDQQSIKPPRVVKKEAKAQKLHAKHPDLPIVNITHFESLPRFRGLNLAAIPRARHPVPIPSARFDYGFHETIGKRVTMEDAMLLNGAFRGCSNEDLFAIFDGHGGPWCSSYVAAGFAKALEDSLVKYPFSPDEALRAAHELISDHVRPWARHCGSTGVVAYIRDDILTISNVGDSRAVLCRGDLAQRLSVDHKPDDEQEKLRIELGGGEVRDGRVNGRLAVSRAFGDAALGPVLSNEPDVATVALQPDDYFLLIACDGFFDVYNDQDAIDVIKRLVRRDKILNPHALAKIMVRKALERGTEDNVSVLIIFLNETLYYQSMQTKSRKRKGSILG